MLTMRKSLQQLHCSVIGLTVFVATSLGSTGVLDGNVVQAQGQLTKHVKAVVRVDQGSGVIIKKEQHGQKFKYLIVTNEHVIQWKLKEPIEIQAIQQNDKLKTYTNAKVTDVAYRKCGLQKYPEYGKQKKAVCYYDLALVELVTADTLQVAPISQRLPEVGDDVITMGYPTLNNKKHIKYNKHVTGNLGEIEEVLDKDEDSIGGLSKIGITADIPVGMSGGPIFNEKGEIVAINSRHTKGVATELYRNPLTNKKPDTQIIKKYEIELGGWAVGRAELCAWKPEFCKRTVNTTASKPQPTPSVAKQKTQSPPPKNQFSIVDIVGSPSHVSGVITKKTGNTYTVHTIMDKGRQGPFSLRVWNGTKMDTISAKKISSVQCDVRNKNCLTTLQFTSKLNLAVAEIGKSTVKVDWAVCMIDFKRAKENSPCTPNTVQETVTVEEHTFLLTRKIPKMNGAGVFYGEKLIGLVAYEETVKQITTKTAL